MKLIITFIIAVITAITNAQAASFVPVLVYHRVTTDHPPGMTVISPDTFNSHVDMLHQHGYTTVRMDELVQYMLGNLILSQKTVVITFDDGWKDQLTAIETLKRYQMSATFFIMSGAFDNPAYFSHQELQSILQYPGFQIGAHSHTHLLEYQNAQTNMDIRVVAGELIMSKLILERLIGRPVSAYAWPYGAWTPQSVDLASGIGFTSSAMINSSSRNFPNTSPLFVQRLNIDGRCSAIDIKAMLDSGYLKECK